MIHKFYEVLHNAEDNSFESMTESFNQTDEMIVLNDVMMSLKGFVDNICTETNNVNEKINSSEQQQQSQSQQPTEINEKKDKSKK